MPSVRNGIGGSGAAATPISMPGLQTNVAAALCYLVGLVTGIIFLVLASYNQNSTIRFHAFQSIFANVAWIILWIGISVIERAMPFGVNFIVGADQRRRESDRFPRMALPDVESVSGRELHSADRRANRTAAGRPQLSSLVRFENADIAQVAVFLGEIESVSNHEFIRNTESHVRDIDRPQSALRLIEQRRDAHRFRFALLQ